MPSGEFPFPVRRHARTGRYTNLPPGGFNGFRHVLRWKLGLGPGFTPLVPPAEVPAFAPEYAPVDPTRLARPPATALQMTWIGHSTWLVQVGGLNILTDPIYSEVCAPVPSRQLRRHSRPGVAWEHLPRIDVVLLSHAHYDHLDRPTIERLGAGPDYVVPEGVGRLVRRWGAARVQEAVWGQQVAVRGVDFLCLPARHFSARTPWDRNEALWCGWLAVTPGRRLYYAGDTAYAPFFADLGRMIGPVDAGLIPIGAYQPRWFMQVVHASPDEAVRIHEDMRLRQSFAMHWGTFDLADEPLAEPPLALARARSAAGLPEDAFRVLRFGETAVV